MNAKVDEAIDTGPLSVLGDALESAAESFGEASVNARASAKVAARKVRGAIDSGSYNAAYGVSYGIVFGAVFLKELLPEDSSVRRGFEEGAEAAFDAIAARKAEAAAHRLPSTKRTSANSSKTRRKAKSAETE